jgi:hypothetical protein
MAAKLLELLAPVLAALFKCILQLLDNLAGGSNHRAPANQVMAIPTTRVNKVRDGE